ncbi:MAG TPA: hypothetical protein VEJ45_04175 [Candidatus Acidoferrales bacterium]|nr:hypothetical protein [Candidatus Acidoferrales bacterium]
MNRGILSLLAIGAVIATASAGPPSEGAGVFDSPRLSDGTPDFRGIWLVRGTAYINLEGHRAEAGVRASPSVVIDPADGRIPYLPEALKQRDQNYESRARIDPTINCFQAGVPRATFLPTPFQIFQSVGHLAIVYTDNHSYRIVLASSIPHDDGIDFFMGDSRGHWEAETLVIDVTDLGDQTWLDAAGNYHSDQLHVVERYTLLGPDTMKYEATMTDPVVYAKPWTVRILLDRDKKPHARIIEDECIDGADGVWQHVSPFDPQALLHHDYPAELAREGKKQ